MQNINCDYLPIYSSSTSFSTFASVIRAVVGNVNRIYGFAEKFLVVR